MKRMCIILVLVIVAVAVTMTGCRRNETKIYPLSGIIVGINDELDLVTFSTSNGNKFSFYGVEDYEEGDRVACIMNDNGTDLIYDDIVILANYQGR